MKEKHTSGPWKVIGEKSNILITGKFTNGKDTYGMPIAYLQTEGNLPASMANARLIAASPELLMACKNTLDIILAYQHIPAQKKACMILQDVIEKAEGK